MKATICGDFSTRMGSKEKNFKLTLFENISEILLAAIVDDGEKITTTMSVTTVEEKSENIMTQIASIPFAAIGKLGMLFIQKIMISRLSDL